MFGLREECRTREPVWLREVCRRKEERQIFKIHLREEEKLDRFVRFI